MPTKKKSTYSGYAKAMKNARAAAKPKAKKPKKKMSTYQGVKKAMSNARKAARKK
jgi:hypothetical protein